MFGLILGSIYPDPIREKFMVYMTRLLVVLLGVTMLAATFAQGGGGDLALTPSFSPDPQTLEYIAGGSVDAAESYGLDDAGELCTGFVALTPDHVLTLEPSDTGMDSFGYLRVYVTSAGNTTLVIERAGTDEVLCNDDTSGTDPQIEVDDWPFGDYNIYVGTFSPDEFDSYTIFFSGLSAD
jgi:hypothetical protein